MSIDCAEVFAINVQSVKKQSGSMEKRERHGAKSTSKRSYFGQHIWVSFSGLFVYTVVSVVPFMPCPSKLYAARVCDKDRDKTGGFWLS